MSRQQYIKHKERFKDDMTSCVKRNNGIGYFLVGPNKWANMERGYTGNKNINTRRNAISGA